MYLFKRSLSCGVENGLERVREAAGGQEDNGSGQGGGHEGKSETNAGCMWKDIMMAWMSG